MVHSKTITHSSIKLKQTSDVNNILSKIRQERKDVSLENRYEITNCSRGLKEVDSESDNIFDLVDLIKKEDNHENAKYIFDIYTSATEDFDVTMLDDLVG